MNNKIITYIYIRSERLPEDGWLQHCICCDTITGNTYDFTTYCCCIKRFIKAYICKDCFKHDKNIKKINKMVPKFFNCRLNQTHFHPSL